MKFVIHCSIHTVGYAKRLQAILNSHISFEKNMSAVPKILLCSLGCGFIAFHRQMSKEIIVKIFYKHEKCLLATWNRHKSFLK